MKPRLIYEGHNAVVSAESESWKGVYYWSNEAVKEMTGDTPILTSNIMF